MIPSKDLLQEWGAFTKLHGYKGELTAFVNTRELRSYESLDHIFVEVKGVLVPYMVQLIEYKTNKTMKVKLEGVDNEEDARRLLKSKIFIEKELLSEADSMREELKAIEGYKVIDENAGDIGIVLHIDDNPVNPLIDIDHNGTSILLPLHEDFILNIDHDRKELSVAAPPGLIDLYLG